MFKDSKAFSSYSIDDIPAAKAFYDGTLGLDVAEQPEGLALNLVTGGSVFLYPKDDHAPATFTVLNFLVDDLAAAVDELTGKGVTMERYDGFDQDERGIATGPSGPESGVDGPSGPESGVDGPSGPESGVDGPSGPESGVDGPSGPHIAWFKDPAGNVLSVTQI